MLTYCLDYQQLHKYSYIRQLCCLLLTSGIILASPSIMADLTPDASILYMQQEPAPKAITPSRKDILADIEILEHDGVFHINFTTTIHASARHVRHVLTDFIHIYRLNPSIIESDVLKRHDDDSVSVKTRIIGCAAYFCEELDRVERVRVLPSGDLLAEIVPEMSHFKSGHTLWRITPTGHEQCQVSYSAKLEPNIFIPPIVGEIMLKKSIREEMQTSFTNLEKISNVVAEMEWQENYQPEHTEFASTEFAVYDPCVNYVVNAFNAAY